MQLSELPEEICSYSYSSSKGQSKDQSPEQSQAKKSKCKSGPGKGATVDQDKGKRKRHRRASYTRGTIVKAIVDATRAANAALEKSSTKGAEQEQVASQEQEAC